MSTVEDTAAGLALQPRLAYRSRRTWNADACMLGLVSKTGRQTSGLRRRISTQTFGRSRMHVCFYRSSKPLLVSFSGWQVQEVLYARTFPQLAARPRHISRLSRHANDRPLVTALSNRHSSRHCRAESLALRCQDMWSRIRPCRPELRYQHLELESVATKELRTRDQCRQRALRCVGAVQDIQLTLIHACDIGARSC